MGIRKSAVLLKKTSKEKEVKYKIKTRHGNIPVYEEKDKPKRKVAFHYCMKECIFSLSVTKFLPACVMIKHLHPDAFGFSHSYHV